MWYTYALISLKDNHLYIGMTQDVLSRLNRHNSGSVKSTKPRRPFRLIQQWGHSSVTEARTHELFLKSGKGREFIKTFIPR